MLTVASISCAASFLAFWALFFLVVLPRIYDKELRVAKALTFGFLWTKWPREELDAYKADLKPEECSKWYNWYLLRAGVITKLLLAATLLALAATALTGSEF